MNIERGEHGADDVPLSARKGKVIVREGKGGDSREIPLLEPVVRTAMA